MLLNEIDFYIIIIVNVVIKSIILIILMCFYNFYIKFYWNIIVKEVYKCEMEFRIKWVKEGKF